MTPKKRYLLILATLPCFLYQNCSNEGFVSESASAPSSRSDLSKDTSSLDVGTAEPQMIYPNTEIQRKLMCITNGVVELDSQYRYDITSSTSRGVVTTPTYQQAKIAFSYQGQIIDPIGNPNGHMQVGLKLNAMNSCNVLYTMWPVAGGPIKVSLKRNDGMIYHNQCKNVIGQGYTILTPANSVAVPALSMGAQHTLQAEYDNTTLRVYADGQLVWAGYLSRAQMPFDGPVGFRSDGGNFKLKFYSNPSTPLSTHYNLSSYGPYSCIPGRPSIRYPSTKYVLAKGQEISPILADSLAGTINTCTIEPAVPGLSVNPSTCAISGVPKTNQASTFHLVTATNALGSFALQISVRVMTPPTIQYAESSILLKKDTPITLTPTYTGNAVESCTVSPALPSGLQLTSKCQITGSPTAITSSSQYQITAHNSVGSYSAYLTLEVKAPPVLIYASKAFTFKLGDRISLTLKSNGGAGSPPTSCAIDKKTPTGTTLNTRSCTISGYANAVQGLTTYTVTGTNEVGSGSVQISVTVTK